MTEHEKIRDSLRELVDAQKAFVDKAEAFSEAVDNASGLGDDSVSGEIYGLLWTYQMPERINRMKQGLDIIQFRFGQLVYTFRAAKDMLGA
jgi:hypothetical protein